jgi:hypothetical protein
MPLKLGKEASNRRRAIAELAGKNKRLNRGTFVSRGLLSGRLLPSEWGYDGRDPGETVFRQALKGCVPGIVTTRGLRFGSGSALGRTIARGYSNRQRTGCDHDDQGAPARASPSSIAGLNHHLPVMERTSLFISLVEREPAQGRLPPKQSQGYLVGYAIPAVGCMPPGPE